MVVPTVEAPDDIDFARVRRPHGEVGALLPARLDHVRPQLVVYAVMTAFIKQIEVFRSEAAHVVARPDQFARSRVHGGFRVYLSKNRFADGMPYYLLQIWI